VHVKPVVRFRVLLAAVGATPVACGGGSSTTPPALTIQKTATASGDGQTDSVLSTLANPIRVLVTMGGPLAGQTVTWAAVGPGASVSSLTSLTDANGVATTTWKLGHVAGAQTVTATLAGATGSPLTFNATATPGKPTQLIQPSGDGQTWMVGTVLKPLSLTVADQYNNGVSGVAVAWQVTSGSASVSPANAMSNASGIAQTTVTLGNTPGASTITATSASLAGSPRSFTVTATAIPTTASVTVGPGIVFTSVANGTANPVDTVAAGGTVTWSWAVGSIPHSVQSQGSPNFTSSMLMSSGNYSFTFPAAGTYHYDCISHGTSMSGTVVVR
jgi:plastocyanin